MSGIVVNLWRNSEVVAVQETTPHKGTPGWSWGCIRGWYRGWFSEKLSTQIEKLWITLFFSSKFAIKGKNRVVEILSILFYQILRYGSGDGIGDAPGMHPPIQEQEQDQEQDQELRKEIFFHDHIEPKQGIKCF